MLQIIDLTVDKKLDKDEILNELSLLDTDDDFNGNNGKEYTWDEALKNGFDSSQEYVIDHLEKSPLQGIELIKEFFYQWLDPDNYILEYDFRYFEVENKLVFICCYAEDR